MKQLQNKKTGEIGCLVSSFEKTPEKITVVEYIDVKRGSKVWYYESLAKLNEEWEDYEEPKEHWCINGFGTPEMAGKFSRENIYDKSRKLIGNDFETKEEAEKAVEKLKAWQRLKDKGFKFDGWNAGGRISYSIDTEILPRTDLDLLFSGGEE